MLAFSQRIARFNISSLHASFDFTGFSRHRWAMKFSWKCTKRVQESILPKTINEHGSRRFDLFPLIQQVDIQDIKNRKHILHKVDMHRLQAGMTWHFHKPYKISTDIWTCDWFTPLLILRLHSTAFQRMKKGKSSEISYQLTSISDNDDNLRRFSIDIW